MRRRGSLVCAIVGWQFLDCLVVVTDRRLCRNEHSRDIQVGHELVAGEGCTVGNSYEMGMVWTLQV